MRKVLICTTFLLLLFSRSEAQDAPVDPKGKYKAIEVTRFDVEQGVDVAPNTVNVLMLEIVDELYKIKKFDRIIKPNSKTAVSGDLPTVRLEGTFLKYHALLTSREALKNVGEFWSRVKVEVRFVDAKDGKELLKKEVDRRILFGVYQFTLKDVTRKAAQDIAKAAKKTFF